MLISYLELLMLVLRFEDKLLKKIRKKTVVYSRRLKLAQKTMKNQFLGGTVCCGPNNQMRYLYNTSCTHTKQKWPTCRIKCSSAHKIKYFYALSKMFCAKIDSPYTLNEMLHAQNALFYVYTTYLVSQHQHV